MALIRNKKKSEIIAFLWLLCAGLTFLCLISYNPNDISFLVSSPNDPTQNFVGIAGAYFSTLLVLIMGKAAYFIVLLMIFKALVGWTERKASQWWLQILSGALFFVSSSSIITLLHGSESSEQFQAGGIIGYFAASLLSQLFGQAAIILASGFFILSLLLTTEFMLLPVLLALGRRLYDVILQIPEWMQSLPFISSQDEESVGPRKRSKAKAAKAKNNMTAAAAKAHEAIKKSTRELIIKKNEPVKPAPIKVKKFENKSKAKSDDDAGTTTVASWKNPSVANYSVPSSEELLDSRGESAERDDSSHIEEQSRILENTLADFAIEAKVIEAEQGPVITRFELQPASGIKLQKITALQDNIALALQATSVRILAPIPGKSRIGVEVPNTHKEIVCLKDIVHSSNFQDMESPLAVAIGKDTAGEVLVADLDQMPHLLIAGSTGSGKTVCMNSIIMSLLFRSTPAEVRFIMIDPKMVELIGYNGLPQLLCPVVTDVDKVPSVLSWLVGEMQRRYIVLSKTGNRDVETYNAKIMEEMNSDNEDEEKRRETFPYIVVIIDELADLMMAKGKEVETAITRLAQLARAVGIHMVLATQRPSVDVITGVIKANFPARIAFQVASKVDSRTVLDANGADCLLGKGDLLYMDPAKPNMIRGQGAWVTDQEISRTVKFIKDQQKPDYLDAILSQPTQSTEKNTQDFRNDEHYPDACRIIVSSGQASVSMLQRRLGLGYTRAARLVDMMEEDGIVGPHRGSKAREVLLSIDELDEKFNKKGEQVESKVEES